MIDFATMAAEMTELLRDDTAAAIKSIAQTHALADRLGIRLDQPSSEQPSRRGPHVSATKGKSKPDLAGWLRRATVDGTLPVPNSVLIIAPRMVRQGLLGGYITGTAHPYRITETGRAYATADFKGKVVRRS